MSHPDQRPTVLELITVEWLPRQTAGDTAGKTDRRDWRAAVLQALCRRPWRTASPQWRRLAALGDSDHQHRG